MNAIDKGAKFGSLFLKFYYFLARGWEGKYYPVNAEDYRNHLASELREIGGLSEDNIAEQSQLIYDHLHEKMADLIKRGLLCYVNLRPPGKY